MIAQITTVSPLTNAQKQGLVPQVEPRPPATEKGKKTPFRLPISNKKTMITSTRVTQRGIQLPY